MSARALAWVRELILHILRQQDRQDGVYSL
jgi:hypothetical protein